jgi:hypothetical protein
MTFRKSFIFEKSPEPACPIHNGTSKRRVPDSARIFPSSYSVSSRQKVATVSM